MAIVSLQSCEGKYLSLKKRSFVPQRSVHYYLLDHIYSKRVMATVPVSPNSQIRTHYLLHKSTHHKIILNWDLLRKAIYGLAYDPEAELFWNRT